MKPSHLIFALLLPVCSFGGTISLTLYNTGVNDDGSLATPGSTDLHYTATNGSTVYVINQNGAWASPTAGQYVAPDPVDGGIYNGGVYTLDYQTTFNLPNGYDPSTVSITGAWATDNYGFNILVNGNSTGFTAVSFVQFYPFTISGSSGFFVNGVNTIDFEWQNFGDLGGIAVESLAGTASASSAPEPASLGLIGLGLGMISLARRKQNRR